MTDAAIAVTKLGHAYRRGHWVFRDCSLSVRKGSVCALLGPNGRGKTTLLKILLGVLKPSEGGMRIEGRTAYVPQLFQATFDYSVLDLVLMGRAKKIRLFSSPTSQDREAAHAMLERLNIGDLAARPFQELSGGQRQLVIFARALVAQADILLLDEPTSSLDLHNQGVILEWIARLAHEDSLTIVFTTHHPHHALAVADDALLMMREASFVSGPADTVLSEANLTALFGLPQKRVHIDHEGRQIVTTVPVFAFGVSPGGI